MPSLRCPKCKANVAIDSALPNAKVVCAVCGQRLTLNQSVAKPPAGSSKTPTEPESDSYPLSKPAASEAFTAAKKRLPKAVPVEVQSFAPVHRNTSSGNKVLIWSLAAGGVFVCFAFCFLAGVVVLLRSRPSAEQASVDVGAKTKAGQQQKNLPPPPKKKGKDKSPVVLLDPALPGSKLDGRQVYDRVLKSTVWINNPGLGSGTGIVIDAEQKLVLTNFHVVTRKPDTKIGKILMTKDGTLTKSDPRDQDGVPFHSIEFRFEGGTDYQIDLLSPQFDPFLRLVNSSGVTVAQEEVGGGGFNSSIQFKPPVDGNYKIIVSSFDRVIGRYKLMVSHLYTSSSGNGSNQKVAPFVDVSFPSFKGGQVVSEKSHYMKMKRGFGKHRAKVEAWSEAKDLAVIILDDIPPGTPALSMATESTRPGQTVHSIGNPGASSAMWVYTSGTVRTAAYQKKWQSISPLGLMKHDAWVIETQSPTNPGDSGGPLANDAGELIAVTQGGNLASNAINLFIDVREVRAFLESKGFGGQ